MQKVIHSGEGVQFMTLHGSKGLEFDTVFMIGNDHKTWTSQVHEVGLSFLPLREHGFQY